jgi:hypothetical protein
VLDPQEYIETRVEDQLAYYEKAANRAKAWHVYTQTAIVILGLLVPVVANLQEAYFLSAGQKTLVITVLSLLLAVLTGIVNFRKFGDLWLAYRSTEEMLKRELFLFETGAGRYRDNEEAFSDFVETTESIISVEHERFRALIESAKPPGKEAPTQ